MIVVDEEVGVEVEVASSEQIHPIRGRARTAAKCARLSTLSDHAEIQSLRNSRTSPH
jgi:hypothetical protein